MQRVYYRCQSTLTTFLATCMLDSIWLTSNRLEVTRGGGPGISCFLTEYGASRGVNGYLGKTPEWVASGYPFLCCGEENQTKIQTLPIVPLYLFQQSVALCICLQLNKKWIKPLQSAALADFHPEYIFNKIIKNDPSCCNCCYFTWYFTPHFHFCGSCRENTPGNRSEFYIYVERECKEWPCCSLCEWQRAANIQN